MTGAGGGLGARISRLLADAGATLTLAGRDQARLEALDLPGATVVAVDLTTPDGPDRAVQAATGARGRLDGVVHAAGVVAFGAVHEVDDDTVDELFLINALAPLRLLRAAHGPLVEASREHGDAFAVTISGVVAEKPTAHMAAYSASKAASWALAAAAAGELRRAKVRVLDARPPHTETGLATRPVAGSAPRLPEGLSADDVAARIVRAITDRERDLPTSAFTAG
ncbi:SDR family NAD(P)-dependent oxidoreductase [Jannaschia sp. R86511]|uniref:SDR family NAD(P)-dependent oxidoreductase n=1 Tax=Jannaschia sp. R86511 TaxID=3093853 RepID=UPI0036D35963